jgi:hypothetical protein
MISSQRLPKPSNGRMEVSNPLQQEGLSVEDATSPSFNTSVQKFLEPEVFARARSFLPQSLVITNNTGRYLWGFTVIYTYPDRISLAGTPWTHRISPTAAGPADRRFMLPPGASYLITPVSDFLASIDAAGNRLEAPYMDEGLERVISIYEAQHIGDRLEVVLDSVIYEDGTLAGPDSAGMLRTINDRIRADKDLGSSLAKLRGEELRSKLALHSTGKVRGAYPEQVADRADSLLRILQDDGERSVVTLLEQMRSVKWFGNYDFVRRRDR